MTVPWQKPVRGTQINKSHPFGNPLLRLVFNEGSGSLPLVAVIVIQGN